jgi:hypothetical protein
MGGFIIDTATTGKPTFEEIEAAAESLASVTGQVRGGAAYSAIMNAANGAAHLTTGWWLMARGLAAEIEDLRWAPESGPVPAPGVIEALAMIEDATSELCAAADVVVGALSGGVDPLNDEVVVKALERVVAHGKTVSLWLRRMATISLGVAAVLPWNDAVARADRAAVAALLDTDGRVAHITDDGHLALADNYEGLAVELRGLFCRMILDKHTRATIQPVDSFGDDASWRIEADTDAFGNLTVTLFGASRENKDRLERRGWALIDAGIYEIEYEDPLPVVLPSGLIIDTVRDEFEVEHTDSIVVTVTEILDHFWTPFSD